MGLSGDANDDRHEEIGGDGVDLLEERSIQHLLSQLLKAKGLRREYIFSECASEASHSAINIGDGLY